MIPHREQPSYLGPSSTTERRYVVRARFSCRLVRAHGCILEERERMLIQELLIHGLFQRVKSMPQILASVN